MAREPDVDLAEAGFGAFLESREEGSNFTSVFSIDANSDQVIRKALRSVRQRP